MEIQRIIQQLLKDSQPEDIWEEPGDQIANLRPITKVSEGPSGSKEPKNSFYLGSASHIGGIPSLIVSKELYPFYKDLDPDEFKAGLNRTLFDYINEQFFRDINIGVPDPDNVWMKSNAAFVNWFHENRINLDSQWSFITIDGKVEKKVIVRPKELIKKTTEHYRISELEKQVEQLKRVPQDPDEFKSLIGDQKKPKKPKGKGGRPPDPKLEKKKNNLRKEYYRLTQKQGYKSSEAIKILSKKYKWAKSTIETYLK